MRVGFCVSGRGTLYRAALLHRRSIGFDGSLLVTETKAAVDLEAASAEYGVKAVRLDPRDRPAFDRDVTRVLVEADLDLIVLTFDRVLPAELVRACEGKIINVHPALLPAFPGTRGMARTLASGARYGGATIHEVVEAIDAGPIIAQAVVATMPDEPADEYGRRMYALLEPMYLQVLRWYAEGRVRHDPQGRILVERARYGTFPVSPALEAFEAAS
ncbi:MAG: phosphoribosylglycinamide formyltransferase [Acidobacteria bacterium]|nr:phosphoribosylglycinamide formyltransferase [Acidobacteriota bacterium]